MTLFLTALGLMTAFGITLALGAPRPRRIPVEARRRRD